VLPSGLQAIPKGCRSSDGNARALVRRLERRCRGARLWHDAYNARRGAVCRWGLSCDGEYQSDMPSIGSRTFPLRADSQ
jgi:hypothetical protein